MIIKNICLFLEALTVAICLHHLYGEKFKLDIMTVSFLSVDIIIMTIINFYKLPKEYTMVIYPVIALYCGSRFGFVIKENVVNVLLCIVLVGSIQWIVALPICYLQDIHYFMDIKLLFIAIISFVIIACGLPFINIKKISVYLQNKEKILACSIFACMSIVSLWLLAYKREELIELKGTFILFACVAFILTLSVQLIKYKMKAKEAQMELRIHKLYSDTFQNLIDNIRLKQHEFDNHINTIYSQHYFYNTYEELVKAQENYCEIITNENRFNKLLLQGNPIICGFLYGKFVKIDRMGIEVTYHILIKELDVGIPVYKIIEILGNLINNAVDALLADKRRNRLYVSIIERDRFSLEVRNESPYIEYNVLNTFFGKGYSKKGNDRGLGLFNVKRICEEYRLNISLGCEMISEESWLSFKVWK